MAGLCGVVGGDRRIDEVAAGLEWTGEETTTRFRDEAIAVVASFTRSEDASQPTPVGEDGLLWVWGSIFGFESAEGYRPRDRTASTVGDYCARLFETHGLDFVSGLNGDFVCLHYDRKEGTLAVATDRLGLRDTYYTRPDEGSFVFSTALQSLSRHPAVTPAFDEDYVTEYFTCGFRTFGTRTPLEDSHLFPPGSVTTVSPDALAPSPRSYWEPHYRPIERPFSEVLEAFVDRFQAAVAERLEPDREYGLTLSGGLDSRLVLAAVPESRRSALTAYHCAGWESREARVARAVAETADVTFRRLDRDADYHRRALERNTSLSNFVGTFEQAHLEGFMPVIRSEVEEVLTASFADSNFKGFSFPRYSLTLGPVGTVHLPFLKPMESVDDYVDFWLRDPPEYLRPASDPEAILRSELHRREGGIDHHGVTYDSPAALFTCGMLTPRTNGSVLFMLQSLRQHLPAWSPFVDNRLVDLYLRTPTRYFVRKNLVRRALNRLDPALAAVPYANTRLPPRYPFLAHFVGKQCVRFADRHLPVDEPPEPHQTNGPWPDIAEVIRTTSFVGEAIRNNEAAIRALPFLDWEGVLACYRGHLEGEDNGRELYGLLTLLETPVTGRIVDAIQTGAGTGTAEREVGTGPTYRP